MGRPGSRRGGVRMLLCTLVGLLLLPGAAVAAECTDTWVGPEAGKWTVTENWSAEHVPTEADVACIPESNRVTVDSGPQRVETLQGGGELVITEGSLTLVSPGEPSNIGTLRLKQGGELGGTGELWVTDLLVGAGGLMKGDGYTNLGSEATGTVVGGEFEGQPGLRVTQKRVLSVHGSLDVGGENGELRVIEGALLGVLGTLHVNGPTGTVVLRESASLTNPGSLDVAGTEARIVAWENTQLSNSGTLVVNSQTEGSGIQLGASASSVLLENTGTIAKTQGTGTAAIEVKLDNEGLVETEAGVLRLSGGGTSGKSAESKWAALSENLEAAETKLVFAAENFALGEAAVVGEVQLVAGSAVTAESVSGEAGSFWLYDGNLHISGGKTVLGKLGVAGGTASLGAGAELSSDRLELTSDYLEEAGVEAVEKPAEAIFATESKIEAESFYQSCGSVQMGSKTSFDGDYVNEGGALAAGDEVVFAGEFFSVEGSFTAGDATQFLFEKPFARGTFELGAGSIVNGDYFWQESGSTNFGPSSTITGKLFWLQDGTATFGESTTLDLSELLYQEEGASTFGQDVSLDVDEWIYFEDGSATFDSGATLETETLYFQSDLLDLKAGSEVAVQQLELYEGEVTGPGSIVTGEIGWWSTVMTGNGTTEVLEKGKIGHGEHCSKGVCEKIPAYAELRERELILHGTFTLTVSTMGLADGAKLVNLGSFDASSEISKWGPQMQIAVGSSSDPKIVNRGRFEKLEGSGTTVVDVPFWNFGAVGQKSGTLDLKQRRGVSAREKFGNKCPCGDPVEASSGDFSESQTDIAVGGLGVGLRLARTYDAAAAASAISPGIFGYGWFSSFGDRLDLEEEGARVTVERADGSAVPFTGDGEGGFDPPAWSQDSLTGSAEAGYTYRSANQIERHFDPSGKLQSVVDRNGNETALAYDEAGRLKAIEDPAGRKITLSYNEAALVESAEGPMGHVVHYGYEGKELASVTMPGEAEPRWRFDYGASHLMTKVVDGRGGETTNEYDASGRVVSQTDPAGRTLNFEYDGFHTRVTNEATGAVTDYWFDSNNQPTSVTRGFGTADATTETFSYDEAGHQLSRTDGNGHTTTYTYNAAGDRTSVTDADENKTEWTYNAAHDVLSETTPRGETTTIVRDAAGNPETVSRPAAGGATQMTTYDFDALGQLESMTDPLERTWSYEYDAKGNLEAETNPEGEIRSWGYDEDSRVTALVRPRGNEEGAEPGKFTTTVQRDPQGRPEKVINPLGDETEFAYDGNGNLESTTNAEGKTTDFVYNADDELVETKKPNGAVLKTEYDGAGEVVAQIDGNGKKTTYVRNALEQPVEVIDPLSRKTVQGYDDAGNLKTVVDPAERVATYSYDPADRLEEIAYSSEATPDVSFEYDADGNLTKMVDGSGESTYAYDQLDRLEEATNGHGDTVSYEYDLAGQQTKIVYPNGKAVDQAFDGAGRLESATDWLGRTTSFAYDADANLEAVQFPASTGNVDEYSYDRVGRMESADFKKGVESIASIAYEHDPLGQVEAMVSEGLPGPEEETYEYDENNRLAKAGSESFEYDKADNPTKTPGSANAFDDASQLKTGTGVTYAYNQLGERTGATATAAAPAYARKFGGESSGPGHLAAPIDTAIDAEGNVWVADSGHNRVQEFDAGGEFIQQFGATGTGAGQFSSMQAIALDAKGNVWVAAGNRVQEFNAKGEFLRQLTSFGGQFFKLSGLATDPEGHIWTLEREGAPGKARLQSFSAEGAYLAKLEITVGKESGQLKEPQALAIDAKGNLWITDTANNRIAEFNAKGELLRTSGSEGSGNGQFKSPKGIATDSEGNVWVSDTANNRIQELSPSGAYLSQLGKSGPNAGQFSEPSGLALDAKGNIWVADAGNDRVQEVAGSEFLLQFGGESSGPGHLSAPAAVAIDSEGDAWVADTAHDRVQEFNGKGEFIRQFGSTGTANGQLTSPRAIALDPKGNVWVADGHLQEFKPNGEFIRVVSGASAPQDIAIDSAGNVWTLETSSSISRIRKFSPEGALLASFGAFGSENGQIKEAKGIAVDAAGNLWIADTGNNRVQQLKPNGEFIRKFGSEGTGNGQFKGPTDVTIDPEGKLWVLDLGNTRVQRFSAEGTYLSQFGAPGPNDGQFSEPGEIAADAKGNLWVADTGNDRVQEVTGSEYIRQFGGQSSGPGYLSAPAGIATDAEGNAWVADTGHDRVQEFNAKGEFIRQFGASGAANGQFSSPKAVALDAKGNLWVADTRLQEFKPNGEFIRAVSAATSPQDIAIDPAGNVWTLEGKTSIRIQKFSSEGALLSSTFLTTGSENGQVKEAKGIAADSSGNLWIADTGNNRLQQLKPNLEFIRKFGSEGTGNGQFKGPTDVTIDPEGKLWALDLGNTRAQRFSAEGAYLSQFGASGSNAGQFSEPGELAADAKGNVWVADAGNDRVEEWQWPRSSTYGYDQAGNLTSVQLKAGTVPVLSESFAFDGSGLMTAVTTGAKTQHLAWDLSGPLPLLLSDGINSYIYGPGGLPIAQISAAEEPTYLHHDQLGSTRLLTDATGKATATFSYAAYGGVEAKTGTATTPLGYAGQYTDSDTGLQYLRARFYDPATAQFLSRDPIAALTREPYAYGRDNPANNADPSGLQAGEEELPCWWCLPMPTPEDYEKAAEEVGNAADEVWNWITGDDDSTAESQPKLSEAEQEYEEEHHECPLERDGSQDKRLTDREIQRLEDAGYHPHDEKYGNARADLYKDRKGNVYEKPKGGAGPGEPIGVNLNDLP